jgi:hypothetical protein
VDVLKNIAEVIGGLLLAAIVIWLLESSAKFVNPLLDRVFDQPRLRKMEEFIEDFMERHRAVQYSLTVLMFMLMATTQVYILYLRKHSPEANRLKEWGLRQFRNPGSLAICITMAVVIFGKLTSLWKQHAQRSYGISEIMFGTLLCFNTVYVAPRLDLSRLVGLGGAMYVVSRGFNNIADSRNKNLFQEHI